MESAGFGDSKIIVLSESEVRGFVKSEVRGFVKSWSIEDEVDNPHCCALWLDE
jgi:hypothetical protein